MRRTFASVDDLRRGARRRLPRVVYDFVAGGAEGELTVAANRSALDAVMFRPPAGVATGARRLAVQVLGAELAMPVLIAPCGSARIVHPAGELGLARAAWRAGTGYVYPHVAGHALSALTPAGGPLWYQLYLAGGRAAAEPALAEAQRAGCHALVLTVDGGGRGVNERNTRNGLRELALGPAHVAAPHLPQLLARPAWLAAFLRDRDALSMPNLSAPGDPPVRFPDVLGGKVVQQDLGWTDLQWIRGLWSGPIVIKGVLTADAARRAREEGADAIVVSNHGGRQLDGAPATIRVLEEIVAAVGDELEILLDGGIERGADVVKALALGARAVLIGRASLWGLAVAGEAGVGRALTLLRDGIDRTLGMLGVTTPQELERSLVTLSCEGPLPRPEPGWR